MLRLIQQPERAGKMCFPISTGAFIFIGLDPNTAFLERQRHLCSTAWGFVVTGHALVHNGPSGQRAYAHTRSVACWRPASPVYFAAGDVRDTSTKQVVSAAGEGSTAALEIREYLKTV
jgi:thioredoxin reductase (NADPH)